MTLKGKLSTLVINRVLVYSYGGESLKRAATGRRRKIHIDLPADVHRKLRLKAVLEDMSMQAFVSSLVEEAVKDVTLPERRSRTGRSKH